MPIVNVEHCKKELEQSLYEVDIFVKEIKTYRKVVSGSYLPLNIRTSEMLIGLQFLMMHLAWEEFLESVFIRYMCGCGSPSGLAPRLMGSKEKCVKDAMTTLLGSHNYLSWSPKETLDRANQYLDSGEPFKSTIGSVRNDLDNMNIIRNRFAHRSAYAIGSFRQLVRRELGYNPRGMTPGRFLLTEKPLTRRKKQTFLKYYCAILDIASNGIAP